MFLQIDLLTFVVLSLAVYRLCRLIVEDTILERTRNLIWSRFPPSTMVGYLFTCYWCTSIWVASLVTISYMIIPTLTVTVSLVLAMSAVAGVIAARVDN